MSQGAGKVVKQGQELAYNLQEGITLYTRGDSSMPKSLIGLLRDRPLCNRSDYTFARGLIWRSF